MKRSGFTMIELIFVIVILGILAAVALPKFIGVSEEAQVSKLKAYVGTLNRTVAPALWSKSISMGDNGSITVAAHVDEYERDLNSSLPPLENITADGSDFSITDLTLCNGTDEAATLARTNVGTAMANGDINATILIGDTTYTIGCVDGNGTNAPQFYLTDGINLVVK